MEILRTIGQTLPSVILTVESPNLNESLNLGNDEIFSATGRRKDGLGREGKKGEKDLLTIIGALIYIEWKFPTFLLYT